MIIKDNYENGFGEFEDLDNFYGFVLDNYYSYTEDEEPMELDFDKRSDSLTDINNL